MLSHNTTRLCQTAMDRCDAGGTGGRRGRCRMRSSWVWAASAAAVLAGTDAGLAWGQTDPAAPAATSRTAQPPASPTVGGKAARRPSAQDMVSTVVVTAQRLNQARLSIEPALGASTYSVSNA